MSENTIILIEKDGHLRSSSSVDINKALEVCGQFLKKSMPVNHLKGRMCFTPKEKNRMPAALDKLRGYFAEWLKESDVEMEVCSRNGIFIRFPEKY